jgi:putative ABC transport system substrate-binding protein
MPRRQAPVWRGWHKGEMRMKDHLAAVLLVFAVATGVVPQLGWAASDPARVGVLAAFQRGDDPTLTLWFEPFRRALSERGWVEGRNVRFGFAYSTPGDSTQLADAVASLTRLNVDLIWAPSAPATRATHAATRSIPIIAQDFTSDPVAAGYVESYGRPGGNLTGVFLDAPEFAGKWFELLRGILPSLSRVVVLWDPAPGSAHLRAVQSLAQSLRIQLQVLEVRKPEDFEKAFSTMQGQPQALIILPSPLFYVQSERLADLAMKYRLPATSMAHRFAEAGGVIAYGPDLAAASERSGVFAARILGGARPSELPVERPTRIQLVINLKAAKTLGLTIPNAILYRADEIIR